MALRKCRECGAEVSTAAKTCPKCGVRRPIKGMSKLLIGFLGLSVLSAWAVIGNLVVKSIPPPTAATATPTANAAPAPEPIQLSAPKTVKIVRQTTVLDDFGGMVSTLTIKNTNKFAIKDLRLLCAHYAPSGTEMSPTVAVIYEILRAGQTRTFHDVKLGYTSPDAKTYSCTVATADPA